MEQTVNKISDAIKKNKRIKHVVVNAAKLVNMQKDKKLHSSVVNSDIINPDGQAVVWASKFLDQPLPERVTGFDLMQKLVKLSSESGFKIFFFGAKEDVVKDVITKYSLQYSNEIIAGYRNGYFSPYEEESIARQIASSKADILFVAISSPLKEIFLEKYKDILNTPFIMGVGGSFDVVALKRHRAPVWIQKVGLEWFFRFLQEPRRLWKRAFVTNGVFVLLIIKAKLLKVINNL